VGIRVVLAEDNTLLREGIAQLLERADDIELVGPAADRPEL
jgi:DNA-binding NarL/FixJ family response regulator